MIFKRLLIFAIFLFPILSSYGQDNTDSTKTTIMCDVEGLPVVRFDETKDTMYVKYFISSSWQDVCNTFHYQGGYHSLTAYCDNMYYNREDYNYDELNALAMFTILFDENLKIKDVRILKRIAYNNNKYDYDRLVKRILWSTEGKWEKESENDHCKWYLHLGYFKLR